LLTSEGIRILREDVARQSDALRRFVNFNANGAGTGRSAIGLAKHSKLGENLAVNLGDKIVLCVGFAPPDLPELNCLNSHVHRLMFGLMGRQCDTVDLLLFGNVGEKFRLRRTANAQIE